MDASCQGLRGTAPYNLSAFVPGGLAAAGAPDAGVLALLASMPQEYAQTTSPADQIEHVALIHALRLEGPGSQSLHLSWTRNNNAPHSFSVRLVFNDRRGSLSAITSAFASLGIDISKVAAYSTHGGVGVDTFTVNRCGVPRAARLRFSPHAWRQRPPFTRLRIVSRPPRV